MDYSFITVGEFTLIGGILIFTVVDQEGKKEKGDHGYDQSQNYLAGVFICIIGLYPLL